MMKNNVGLPKKTRVKKSIEETAMSDMSIYINKCKGRQMTRYPLIHYKKIVNIHKSDPFKQKVGFIIQT